MIPLTVRIICRLHSPIPPPKTSILFRIWVPYWQTTVIYGGRFRLSEGRLLCNKGSVLPLPLTIVDMRLADITLLPPHTAQLLWDLDRVDRMPSSRGFRLDGSPRRKRRGKVKTLEAIGEKCPERTIRQWHTIYECDGPLDYRLRDLLMHLYYHRQADRRWK